MAAPERRKLHHRGDPTLPPPGDERRDVLLERKDALEEAAETGMPEMERIDPKKLRVENELAQHFNELDVSNQDPMYSYRWVQAGFYGRFIKAALSEKWEVVQGDMQEAIELKGMGADTTRRLGDVVLMRIRRDYYKRIVQAREARQRAVESGVTSELEELGDRYKKYGAIVRTSNVPDHMMKRMANRAEAAKRAGDTMDQWVREGRVPGNPADAHT